MANRLKPSDFSQKAVFSTIKPVLDRNTGVNHNQLTPVLTLYVAPYTVNISRQMSLTPEQQNQKVIIVRHNSKIKPDMVVTYMENDYYISLISPDEKSNVIMYDYLTLNNKGDVNG